MANGIVQVDANGLITAGTVLPDGTTSTTQSAGDNTTKNATTEFVQAAISAGSGVIHEELNIDTPGKTVFTLTNTPVDADRSILAWNGVIQVYGTAPAGQYTISGNTLTWVGATLQTNQKLHIWHDITIAPPGTLDQQKMYFVGKAGSDTNDGKSIEKPFLTIGKAITEVNLQTPGFTNQWEIEVVDGGRYSESFTMSAHTALVSKGATVVGNITLGSYSIVDIRQIEGSLINSGVRAWVNVTAELSNATGKVLDQVGGVTYLTAGRILNDGTAGFIELAGAAVAHIKSTELYPGGFGIAKFLLSDSGGNSPTIYVTATKIRSDGGGAVLELNNASIAFMNIDNWDSLDAYDLNDTSKLYLNNKLLTGTTSVGGSATFIQATYT